MTPEQPINTVAAAMLNPANGVSLHSSRVKVEHLDGNLCLFIVQLSRAHKALFAQQLIITSANDGQHTQGSAHYRNRAVDIRTKDKTELEQAMFLAVAVFLGARFGVAVFDERLNPAGAHFHCQMFG